MVVLEAHLGLRKYAYFIQASQHSLRQGEPPTRQRILLVRHVQPPYADCRTGIGQPTARRIISLRQPAQHRYFRGSSMEIAKLSPLRSSPPPAQAAHCAPNFLPPLPTFPPSP